MQTTPLRDHVTCSCLDPKTLNLIREATKILNRIFIKATKITSQLRAHVRVSFKNPPIKNHPGRSVAGRQEEPQVSPGVLRCLLGRLQVRHTSGFAGLSRPLAATASTAAQPAVNVSFSSG